MNLYIVMDHTIYNLSQACEAIGKHYGRDLINLKFETPPQVFDGCVVKFTENNEELATGRIRFSNKLIITSEFDLLLVASITDISYKPSIACLTIKLSALPTNDIT